MAFLIKKLKKQDILQSGKNFFIKKNIEGLKKLAKKNLTLLSLQIKLG